MECGGGGDTLSYCFICYALAGILGNESFFKSDFNLNELNKLLHLWNSVVI